MRIVSLAPSLTEIVFALGLGDRVVGVSTESYYPPEAAEKPVVGRFLAVSTEAIVALEPDLVLVPPTTRDLTQQLQAIGVNAVLIEQFDLAQTLASIEAIGKLCGVEDKARAMVAEINAGLDRVRARTQEKDRPRVLMVVGRNYDAPQLEDVYVAASNSFYGELVELAGGTSAYVSESYAYPLVSIEGIMKLNPDVVFDIVPHPDSRQVDYERLKQAWQTLPELAAVQNDRVYVLGGDYIGIPGPRLVRIVEDMAARLHPEAQP